MSSGSSSTSLARTTSSGGSSRRPRPRSPPSMYVAYESAPTKAPKPLIKLDKKPKNKPTKSQPESYPNPFPVRSASLFGSASAPPAVTDARRRPSIPSFLGLRRKMSSGSPVLPPSSRSAPHTVGPTAPSYHLPTPNPATLHQTNVHPIDDIEPVPWRSDKANRLLGKALPLHSAQLQTSPDRDDVIVSDFSGTFRIASRSSSPSEEDSSWDDDASSVSEDSFDEGFADDSHIQRESMLLTPMEFRPPSVALFAPLDGPAAASEVDEWEPESEPVTPVGPLHSRRMWDEPPAQSNTHTRSTSYASVHDHYMHPGAPSTPPMGYRPDTPFMDTLVALNSEALVARGGHVRESSIIRSEPREGWMGEWNQEDMRDVIDKLRTLK